MKSYDTSYFDRQDQALSVAIGRAQNDGALFDAAELETQVLAFGPVNYGQTVRSVFPLVSLKGKATRKALTVVLYRMENSGRYELTSYIA